MFLRRIRQTFRYVSDLESLPQGLLFPDELFHIHQIDHPLK